MDGKKRELRGVQESPRGGKFRARIEIFGKPYFSDDFDHIMDAAIMYDALCVVTKRESRRNFPGHVITGGFMKLAKQIYREAKQEHPEEVKQARSKAASNSRIQVFGRSDRESIIIETAQTAGMQHAAANPAMPLVDTTLKASVLTHKLGVKDPDTATRLMMTQFPWTTTLKERQLYWRAFARGCEKIVLNRRKRGVSAAEAAQIAASF